MITPTQINPYIISDEMEGNAVLYSPTDGRLFVLCELGTLIWQMLAQQQPISAILDFVVTHYRVSVEEATNDLTDFLAQLNARQLTLS